MTSTATCERDFDFALVLSGVSELGSEVETALFEAGCDDATVSLRYGCLYLEFTRTATTLKDAILSAIRDVRAAGIGAEVARVDGSQFVTPAEIARRIGRSRQLVHQYMNGLRGPGGFPSPECNLTDTAPLWSWCAVTQWLGQHDMMRPEELRHAEVVATINTALEGARQRVRNADLVEEIAEALGPSRPAIAKNGAIRRTKTP